MSIVLALTSSAPGEASVSNQLVQDASDSATAVRGGAPANAFAELQPRTELAARPPGRDRQRSHELVDLSTLVADLLASANEILDRDREAARRCIVHAAAVTERICRRPRREEAAKRSGLAPWQVRRVEAYIDANLAARINLDNLSEVARLSTSHFSRAFKRSFGMAPYAFVLRRRMEHAQRLMLTTQTPLCEIALECGLSDQSHFSRLFQRTIGTSPNKWRRFWGHLKVCALDYANSDKLRTRVMRPASGGFARY